MQWQTFEKKIMNLPSSLNVVEFTDDLGDYQLVKKDDALWSYSDNISVTDSLLDASNSKVTRLKVMMNCKIK
jgi:hypothetical protein